MPYASLLRSVLLVAMASGLPACCPSPPWTRHPPPPAGPGSPPPPAPHDIAPHATDQAFEAALAACAEELDLPPPPDRDDDEAHPAPAPDDIDLMDACLEAQGFIAPPPPHAPRGDDPA